MRSLYESLMDDDDVVLQRADNRTLAYQVDKMLESKTSNPELIKLLESKVAIYSVNDKDGLEEIGNKLLSNEVTTDTYSAEFNFIGNNVKAIVSYEDENNYYEINLNNDILSFTKIKNGSSSLVKSVEFNKDYNYDVLHTLRIAHKDGKVIIYFDNLNKISLENEVLPKGKIGYVNDDNI